MCAIVNHSAWQYLALNGHLKRVPRQFDSACALKSPCILAYRVEHELYLSCYSGVLPPEFSWRKCLELPVSFAPAGIIRFRRGLLSLSRSS